MADNYSELPDTGQLYSGFRKASEILKMQTTPKYTEDSTTRPASSILDTVSVSQPAATVSYVYANMPCREWFEAKDNDFYFDCHSQSSTPNFSQSSNLIDTNCKGVFIQGSAVTATISQKKPNEVTREDESLSEEARFIKSICPSHSHNTTTIDDYPRFGHTLNKSYSEAYALYQWQKQQSQTIERHHVLTNPFLFTSMKNRIPSLPRLPRLLTTTKANNLPFRNTGGASSLSWMTNNQHQASSSAAFPHSKKNMYQIKNQGSLKVFGEYPLLETPTSPSGRPRKKVCRISDKGKVGCAVSSISSNTLRVALDLVSEYSSDDEAMQSTTITKDPSPSSSSDEETPEDYNLSKVFYGLFGSEPSDTLTGENYFKKLPDELKKIIFCQLHSSHLFEICPMVCRDWRRIINNKKFMPWKFHHYCYKKNGLNPDGIRIPSCYDYFDERLSIASLISIMQTHSSAFTDLLPSLKRHVYHDEALLLLKTSFPECFFNNIPSPWSLIIMLCIISDSVKLIQQLLQILVSASSKSSLDVLLDKVYKILYIFICQTFQSSVPVLYGIIYRLTSALHMLENFGTVTVGDLNASIQPTHQQSILKYCESSKKIRFSSEQLRILNYNVQPGDIIKIVAYAGTGKTATLVRYTKMRPGLKFLLVVFNKSVAEHAKKVFPENVHCTTGHSLAFKNTGFIYAKNGKLHLRNLKVCDLEGALKCAKDYNSILHCQVVLTVLEHFFASKDIEIQYHHVQAAIKSWEFRMHQFYSAEFCWEHLFEDANTFWHQMIDLDNKNIKMTHDGYLKLYQIKKPQLSKYDVILIDEAQDLTPAIANILVSQKQAKIIVVDPYQQVHDYCEASNLMKDIEASHIFYLTLSFRFGHDIASVANFVLNYYTKSDKMLFGSSKESTIEGKDIGQVAYISRCNSVLFKMAAFVCCVQKPKMKVFFLGGLASWEFDLLRRLCIFRDEGYFKPTSSSRDIFLSKFPSYWALSQYVKESRDMELLPKVKILEQYTSNLHKVLSYIERSEVKDINDADVIFTTAQKAKGLEFSTVKILDDFNIESYEERNLLYVALTRAKNSLYLDRKIISSWEKFGELRLKVRSYDSVTKEELVCCCISCPGVEVHDEILPPIVIEKKRLRLVDDTEAGGFICKTCLIKLQCSLSFLYGKYDSKH